MPELTWIGKDKVVNHHHDVPFRILEKQYEFASEPGAIATGFSSGNKIIHGDNLAALKSLLPEYEGRVKCIYKKKGIRKKEKRGQSCKRKKGVSPAKLQNLSPISQTALVFIDEYCNIAGLTPSLLKSRLEY